MLVSPKWQTMWMESQHCSESIVNVSFASQQSKKVLEDLRTNCCSPNKAVQLEALKCWGVWIRNQNSEDWKLKTLCFTAVRPLITKKLQPLHKDVDICKLRLSLMWALLVKVENIMQLEGPQYILEVFLQSCLLWLSSTGGEECENEVSLLILQLLLSILSKNETICGHDRDLFVPLSTDVLHLKKVFHRLADKFMNVFIHWRKVPDKKIFLKLWTHFLEHCELSCEHIPIPLWHKIFKLADQICSEKNEPVKDRLAFLHSCVTTLKSALSSSKFIDFGNLLTTPCEALFKKLVELCMTECPELCDSEMFLHSMETCRILSDRSVAIGGFDLCIHVLDVLEEFWSRELFWGVWCGMVHCYKVRLHDLHTSNFSKDEMKFYRKLRGVAVNFDLDRDTLHEDCITEVEKHMELLNIGCFRCCPTAKPKDWNTKMQVDDRSVLPYGSVVPYAPFGRFSTVALNGGRSRVTVVTVKLGLVKDILRCFRGQLTNGLLDFWFTKTGVDVSLTCAKAKDAVPECAPPVRKDAVVPYRRQGGEEKERKEEQEEEERDEEEPISTPKTRSMRRAEEKRKEMENQGRKKRKSFEVLVQEIVRKNKERKTEKNSRRSSVSVKGKRTKKKPEKDENADVSVRKLRNLRTEETKKRKSFKTDGKLENYFKVIAKKSGDKVRKVEKKPRRAKEGRKESACCNAEKEDGKGEIGWRQTSLKTMMNRRTRSEKSKQKSRVAEEKAKTRKTKVTDSPLSKLSPFKEVFHDHEYAKMETEKLESFERVLMARQGRVAEVTPEKKRTDERETKRRCVERGKPEGGIELPKVELKEEVSEVQVKAVPSADVTEVKVQPKMEVKDETMVTPDAEDGKNVANVDDEQNVVESEEPEPANNDVTEESSSDVDLTGKRGKKRVRMLDSLKPSKKMKVEGTQDDKLPVEEKENVEEKQSKSPTKKGKPVPSCPLGNEMISSRALRMIALVPESTKGSQIQRDAPPRAEVLKCKKAPNVDVNSRASKMLALLSENVTVETEDEDVTGGWTTPNVKTPASSLKSPKSTKKRRSIRFDDAKNETVVYQTDTPPSQILEEKEKRRRFKLAES